MIHLQGFWKTKEIYLDGKALTPDKSFLLCKHSPDGFNWGYLGSGAGQLALALCQELYGDDVAREIYMKFKVDFIKDLPQDDFIIDLDVNKWFEKLKAETEK